MKSCDGREWYVCVVRRTTRQSSFLSDSRTSPIRRQKHSLNKIRGPDYQLRDYVWCYRIPKTILHAHSICTSVHLTVLSSRIARMMILMSCWHRCWVSAHHLLSVRYRDYWDSAYQPSIRGPMCRIIGAKIRSIYVHLYPLVYSLFYPTGAAGKPVPAHTRIYNLSILSTTQSYTGYLCVPIASLDPDMLH